jgi:hypothetical protein
MLSLTEFTIAARILHERTERRESPAAPRTVLGPASDPCWSKQAGRQGQDSARRSSSRGPGAAAGEEIGVGGGGRHVVVARRGARRRNEPPGQHRRERPRAGAPAAASAHPPLPFPDRPRRRRRHAELLPRAPGGNGWWRCHQKRAAPLRGRAGAGRGERGEEQSQQEEGQPAAPRGGGKCHQLVGTPRRRRGARAHGRRGSGARRRWRWRGRRERGGSICKRPGGVVVVEHEAAFAVASSRVQQQPAQGRTEGDLHLKGRRASYSMLAMSGVSSVFGGETVKWMVFDRPCSWRQGAEEG